MVNGPRPQHPDDKPLNPNLQQIQPRPGLPPQAGGPIRPAGAPPPRNVFLQRPPGPRPGPPGPPGAPYPPPSGGPRFPPPNPGIREPGPQGPQNFPSGITPGPGFHPNSSVPGPQRPPLPGQAPERPRGPLTRNPSLSQEDHNFGPRPPYPVPQNRLQRNDSTSSISEQKVFGGRPPRILIDRTMSESEDQGSKPGTPKSTVPSKPENENEREKMEPKVVQNRPLIEPDKSKVIRPQSESVSEVKKLEQDSKPALRNLVQADSLDGVKGFDNGKERTLSAKSVAKDDSGSSAKVTEENKTPDQEKKKAHFSEDVVEMKDKSKADRKTWSSTERSPRNSAKDRDLMLTLKAGGANN